MNNNKGIFLDKKEEITNFEFIKEVKENLDIMALVLVDDSNLNEVKIFLGLPDRNIYSISDIRKGLHKKQGICQINVIKGIDLDNKLN